MSAFAVELLKYILDKKSLSVITGHFGPLLTSFEQQLKGQLTYFLSFSFDSNLKFAMCSTWISLRATILPRL